MSGDEPLLRPNADLQIRLGPNVRKGSKATPACDVVGCAASFFWRSIPPADRVLLNSAQHSALLRTRMSGIFHRQLAEYADYHRDQRNCLMHIIGNPILFVAAVLPLSLLSVTVFGVETSAALLLVIPALILWISYAVFCLKKKKRRSVDQVTAYVLLYWRCDRMPMHEI